MSIKRWHKSDFDRSSLSPPSPAVSVLEVECVREGCQSETLRQMAGSVPEGRCLTVVFKGPRKSLDLLCQSQEEAQQWVRGIRRLQERVENMTEKEKLDQYPVPSALPGSHVSSLTVRWWEQSKPSLLWGVVVLSLFFRHGVIVGLPKLCSLFINCANV